jgi:hypothetical protein
VCDGAWDLGVQSYRSVLKVEAMDATEMSFQHIDNCFLEKKHNVVRIFNCVATHVWTRV